MQFQKDDIRKTILQVARHEFIAKGFKDASMRTIAAKSGIGLSNIYNYFRNKDEIFTEVLSGLLAAMKFLMDEHNKPENIDLYIQDTDAYVKSQIKLFFGTIHRYKEDFNLLLFKSAGSSLENFRKEYINRHTAIGVEYLKIAQVKYPFINTIISPFFIHTMSSWWMSILGEMVSHNLTDKELEDFIHEFIDFGTAGWKRIMKIKG